MNSAVNVQEQVVVDSLPINIEAIKKAFIQLNQLPAANEQFMPSPAPATHVIRVKDWLQDLERDLGVKAKVVASPQQCGLSINAPAAIVDDEAVLFANCIDNQKMAMDVFEYAVGGLLGVQRLLKKENTCLRIFTDLDADTQEFLIKRHNLPFETNEDKVLLLKMHLADLAGLNVRLTWLERREAWQRQLVRLFYPKLKFESLDLHYLLLKARRLLRKG
ncbi:MAG: hypothetical protein ACI8SR_003228 [Oceanicoccus sp.]